jgi:hypothetical protein
MNVHCSSACVVVLYQLISLYLKLLSAKLSYFGDIWHSFGGISISWSQREEWVEGAWDYFIVNQPWL